MMIYKITKPELPFPCSEKFYNFLLRNKEKIDNDDTQIIGILWGLPGSGKSVLAQKIAYVCSKEKINIQKIAFNKPEIIQAILISRKEVVIGDEGISMFFSRAAMTKEGRLMAELTAQCRQRNLHLIICITDPLKIDEFVLSMSNYVCHVWENRKEINGRMVTIKGNFRLYPNFKQNSYKNRMIQYLKIHRSNPLLKLKPPRPWLTEAGQPFGETFKPGFYAVNEAEYKAKKESILEKYRKALDRKPRNTHIDYSTMDKLIKAHVLQKEIAKHLNVSIQAVRLRSVLIKHKHKKYKQKKHNRG